jgi:hypothetical protein
MRGAGAGPSGDAAEMTPQSIFFNGNEAFITWTDADSIYGAK